MSFKLILKNPDGTTYWVDNFPTREALDRWYAEEQTRPYWNPLITAEILDESPRKPTQEELDAIEAERVRKLAVRDSLKALKKNDFKNVGDAEDAILKLIDLLDIRL